MTTRISAGVCFVFWSLFVCIISAIGLFIVLLFWINEMVFGIPEENVEEGILNILFHESMTVTELHKRIQEQYCFSKLSVELFQPVLYDLLTRGLVERDFSIPAEMRYHLSEKGRQATNTV